MPEETYRRRSARVLLVDAAERILLLRMRNTPSPGHCWLTPGGGVDPGESLPDAAARELWEETGLRVTPAELGPQVATTAGYARFDWAEGVFRDDFFFLRITAHEVDTSRLEPLERRMHGGHRWWSLPELASTDEAVYPWRLVPLLTDLLAGRTPAEPVSLPWHH